MNRRFDGTFELVRSRLLSLVTTLRRHLVIVLFSVVAGCSDDPTTADVPRVPSTRGNTSIRPVAFKPRMEFDTSGFSLVGSGIARWPSNIELVKLAEIWDKPGARAADVVRSAIPRNASAWELVRPVMASAMFLNYEGDNQKAYDSLSSLRMLVEKDSRTSTEWLYTIIYFQGVTALRQGENDNSIACRGESSCILPLLPAAIHLKEWGSRAAIKHFEEYLAKFPSDRQVQWLLNLGYMTLGEYPDHVPPRFLISIQDWGEKSPVGAFRDVSAEVGLDRLNQSGGGILDDFDQDGFLDVAVTSINPQASMGVYRNRGNGEFSDVSSESDALPQLGGLFCVQADYNNDGFVDIFIPRGAWFLSPIRPTLLRNEGDGTWTDATVESGLNDPVNSNSACWADFDKDGDLDLFVCCERQENRLFRNNGEEGFARVSQDLLDCSGDLRFCKGATWVDFNNDGWPDLFINNLQGKSQLLQNAGGIKFLDVTTEAGVGGPETGFACWTWDYDNDGWLDIFATSYDRGIADVISGLAAASDTPPSSRLWHNLGAGRFEDASVASGVSGVFETMGCNFGDIDNDGWLDFYLGTGDPEISTLIPNRLFHNVLGQRFAEITASSRTGSLQKGHAVSFADWDRNGDLDIFIQMGGAIPGDQYHNMMYQNAGSGNHSMTFQLHGTSSCRSAIGARIRIITSGENPQTLYSMVSSGSSFGANPLEVHIGIGQSTSVDSLEIQWPGSATTQTFQDLQGDGMFAVIEGKDEIIPIAVKSIR